MKKNYNVINKVINFLFKGLVLLLPLFFLPWTTTLSGMDNFNKQNLLFLVLPVIGFLFFFTKLKQGKLNAKCSIMDYPILTFLGVVAVASIFSVDKFSSVFGAYSFIEQSFIVTFCLALLYFFVVNFFTKESDVASFLKIFFKVYVVLTFTSSILVVGYWTKLLSSSTISAWFKLGVGTLDDLAIFIAIMNVLIFGLLYDLNYAKSVFKNILWERLIKISIVLSFVLLILINFTPAWICLFVGAVFIAFVDYFYFGAKTISFGKKLFRFTRDKKVLWLNIAILIPLVIIMFNSFTFSDTVNKRRYAQKLQMDHAASMELSRQVVKKSPLFGYGPESFNYAFSLLRSPLDNESEYWYLRYSHGSSYFLNLIVTTGMFGFLTYLAIIGLIIFVIFSTLRKNHNTKGAKQGAVITSVMAVLLSLICGQIFYSVNIVLLFLFWLFLGLLMVCVQDYFSGKNDILVFKNKSLDEEMSQRISIMVVFVIFFIWFLVFGLSIRYFIADYNFRDSLGQCSYAEKEKFLQKAIKLNPERFNYQVAMAKYYKEKVMIDMNQEEKNIEEVKNNIRDSIMWAKNAIKQAPHSVVAYETLGSVYRDLSLYIDNNNGLVAEAFRQAILLEPSNPVLAAELGKSYLASSLYDEAIKAFQYSLNLRGDNYEAAYGLSKALLGIGQTREAMNILAELEKKNPTVDVYYELGRILFNMKNYDEAIVRFQQVVSISPLHSNALYSLGLSLENNEEYEAALHYFKKVLQLNPGNTEIENKINEVEAKF